MVINVWTFIFTAGLPQIFYVLCTDTDTTHRQEDPQSFLSKLRAISVKRDSWNISF